MIATVRKYHKWLMAFIGIQFVFWSISGLYMVSMNIHYIHGETLVTPSVAKVKLSQVSWPITALLKQFPQASELSVESVMSQLVYQFKQDERWWRVDATTGQVLPGISEADATNIAQQHYRFEHAIQSVALLTDDAPSELSSRHLPAWRVEFEHFASPTLYISESTGQVVTKRHSYWRIFDWLWRFHIMDYDDGENVANWLLSVLAITGLLSALAGAVLTFYRVFKADAVAVG